MLTGKRFRIERATLSVEAQNGKRKAVLLPAGALIQVLSESQQSKDALIDVRWEGRTVSMFAVDVDVRGTEVLEQSVGA